jgi:peroxiredoxin
MKNLLFIIPFFLFSCNNTDTKKDNPKAITFTPKDAEALLDKTFDTDWESLTKNFDTWYNYTYYNVKLSDDFIGLDTDSKSLDKETFLNKLQNEDVVAYKTKIIKGQSVYQLFKNNSNNESIKNTSKQNADAEMSHFKMEGNSIPDFNFTDINGKEYNAENTKGKIVVLKCWFIGCVACVKEFPALNNLIDEFKDQKDILFVSLAMDTKEKLVEFLKTKEFKYATVPVTKSYFMDKLNVSMFPTHLLVNRNGRIVKVVNSIEELVPFLKKEVEGKE